MKDKSNSPSPAGSGRIAPGVSLAGDEGCKQGELVDDFREFFAPTDSDLVDGLIGSYQAMRVRVEAKAEAEKVLEAIGGVWDAEAGYWQFDYKPGDVLDDIVCSGCIPDQKSYQYYPTPATVGKTAMALAQDGAGPGMVWLEPSAGTGGLADLVPDDAVLQCVEISPLHCAILKSKGRTTIEADFLKWRGVLLYDRVVMNPPFSQGRWQAHLEHAASMVATGGRLVAVLPASAKGKDLLPGFATSFVGPFSNEFAGTSVSVVILVAENQAKGGATND